MRTRLLLLASLLAALALAPAASAADEGDPFSGQGMWIWQLAKAAGGDPVAIAQQAQAAGIDTVIIKAADGPTAWSQFSPTLVSALQAQGMTVCAYQRLKGKQPSQEAIVAAQAVAAGADCFVIDAEAELEGRYAQARTYVKALRKRIGPDFPVAYTTFPYLDVHPLEPVSVFLGAGAATVNMPQIYWKDIGNSPAVAWARTVAANRVYQAPLAPIGQLYEKPKRTDVLAFRRLALSYDASGLSWWSWDGAISAGWAALAPVVTATALPVALPAYPTVKPGARSDLVVWAKDHLRPQGYVVTSDTRYDATTVQAVKAFQAAAGLPVDGIIGPTTWESLLAG